jgi:hypothetical protein
VGRNVYDNVIQRLLKNKIRVLVTHHQDFLRQSDLVIKIKGKKFQSLIPRENNLELEELDVVKKDKLPSPQDGPRNAECAFQYGVKLSKLYTFDIKYNCSSLMHA